MSQTMFEPHRLRESPERASSIEGRLASQLRLLSVYAPMPQLRRYSAVPRRRRYILTAVRGAAVAAIGVTVSGVATATASYVVRQGWPRPAVGDGPQASQRSPRARRPHPMASPAEPAGARVRETEAATAAAAPSIAPPASEPPASRFPPKSRSVAAMQSGGPAAQPYGRPEAASGMLAPTFEPPTMPALPWPTGTASPGPSGHATSQVRVDRVTQEAGLLRQALAALRRDHDAKRALALLDEYDRRFGQGALALEATSARAQALLRLGDTARALELLDRLPLWPEGHTGELRVIRGELRSLSGRCRDALLDFDTVLRASAGNDPDEVARALFGRASCRARTGDLVGAEEDRRRYLKEFPQGPAAGQLLSPP